MGGVKGKGTSVLILNLICRLWVETVNALRPAHLITLPPYTHQQLTEDPLNVLRCDTKVFRCVCVYVCVCVSVFLSVCLSV